MTTNNGPSPDTYVDIRGLGIIAGFTVIIALTVVTIVFITTLQQARAHEVGIASVYTTKTGSRTASGRALRDHELTAAHRRLPFGTMVQVTNKRNGKSATVMITDRGPFVRGRVIDLSLGGARAIGMGYGLAPVHLSILSTPRGKCSRLPTKEVYWRSC